MNKISANDPLKKYITVYKNCIDNELCDKIVNYLEIKEFQKHTFYNSIDKNHYRKENNECDSYYGAIDDQLREILMKTLWERIYQYVTDLDFPWFGGWQGFTEPKWNRYQREQCMSEHSDFIKSIFDGERKGDPTLSVVGVINNDFEGGELIFFQNEKYLLKKGDIIIFPSTFLYPHRLNNVTSGTRYSFVSWVF